jgi:RNA polymerase-binding transcription factor DksA
MEVIMSANQNTRAIDDAVDRSGGLVWHRLHSERENISEALLRESVTGFRTGPTQEGMSQDELVRTANWHKELLQARLNKIDDALDRLMSGSYGNCRKCGRWIEDTKLDFDPAVAFCLDCWARQQSQTCTDRLTRKEKQIHSQTSPTGTSPNESTENNPFQEGVALETLAPSDTICVCTRNSEYRIFLLDARTGRALIEGGPFVEPLEAMVNGSMLGSKFMVGWIGLGLRMEFCAAGQVTRTSPVQSYHVQHHTSDESVPNLRQ